MGYSQAHTIYTLYSTIQIIHYTALYTDYTLYSTMQSMHIYIFSIIYWLCCQIIMFMMPCIKFMSLGANLYHLYFGVTLNKLTWNVHPAIVYPVVNNLLMYGTYVNTGVLIYIMCDMLFVRCHLFIVFLQNNSSINLIQIIVIVVMVLYFVLYVFMCTT